MKTTLRQALALLGLNYDMVENNYPSTLAPDVIVFLTSQKPRQVSPSIKLLGSFPLYGDILGDFVLKNRAIVYSERGAARVVLEWG